MKGKLTRGSSLSLSNWQWLQQFWMTETWHFRLPLFRFPHIYPAFFWIK